MKLVLRITKLAFAILLFFTVVQSGWQLYWLKTTPHILLTHAGFEPDVLVIHEGETVAFRTTRGQPFWPASNDHPAHLDYADFDPKRAIGPHETWQFRFMRTGSWDFHNHIGSSYAPDVGTIIVLAKDETITDRSPAVSKSACLILPAGGRRHCWERLLKQTLAASGIQQTYALVAELYREVPDFASSCNAYTHRIGGQSYLLYRKQLDAVMIPETLTCGAGFFHGFMEVFVTQERRLDRAQQFCSDVAGQLAKQHPLAMPACIHGLGHGIMELLGVHTISDWNVLPAMLAEGFSLCESMYSDRQEHCVNGMFNAVLMHYTDSPYTPAEHADNPFWFCPGVPEKYKPFCYEAMGIAIQADVKRDMGKAVKYLTQRVPGPYVRWSLRTVIQDLAFASVTDTDWNLFIRSCKQLQSTLSGFCLETFAESLVDNGIPGHEYSAAFAFCRASVFTTAEQESCLRNVMAYMQRIYGTTFPKTICANLPADLKYTYCTTYAPE